MKKDDIFHPAINEEQLKKAEELLKNSSLEMFVEKRTSSNKYRPGRLIAQEQNAKPIKVLVSTVLEEQPSGRALLADEAIPNIECAELVIEEDGKRITLKGRVETSHPGQRKDDRELNVTRFYEQTK
ncbi:MAG: hypothetical protein AAF446_02735 [Pseudomonadota bacterium]